MRSGRHPRQIRCAVPGRIDLPSRGRHLPLAPNPFPFFFSRVITAAAAARQQSVPARPLRPRAARAPSAAVLNRRGRPRPHRARSAAGAARCRPTSSIRGRPSWIPPSRVHRPPIVVAVAALHPRPVAAAGCLYPPPPVVIRLRRPAFPLPPRLLRRPVGAARHRPTGSSPSARCGLHPSARRWRRRFVRRGAIVPARSAGAAPTSPALPQSPARLSALCLAQSRGHLLFAAFSSCCC